MNKHSDSIHVCQAMQLVASDVLGDLISNPDLLNMPWYKELTERVYMAARQSATVAQILGDDQTAKYTNSVCEKLLQIADL